ncbi:RNA 3'-terminal phosphate cyclase-like protein [Planococcus citri]|uniref:RNA 3'-terminal phosphate cyclase-like protein n=1 Tax=Planococcus citri TaxID=170843 RepID=UPI0031F7A382
MVQEKGSRLVFKGSNYFRQRIALSILSGRPIEITDIRAQSEEPGLKEHEVNLLRLVDKMTNGMVIDINEIGTKLFFQPGLLTGGIVDHECCKERGIGYYLEVIFILAPFFKKGLQITLRGVTNHEKDPPVDAFKHAAIPILKQFMYIPDEIEFNIKKRGVQPNGGGEIYFNCPNIKKLKAVQVMDYGKIRRIRGTVFSLRVSPSISNRMVEKAKGAFLKFIPDVYLSVDHMTGQRAGKSPGFGACLYSETTSGVFMTSDVVSTPGQGVKTVPEELAEKGAFLLLEEICRGGCIDSSFQSLACTYMALQAKDLSQYLFGPLSPYTVQFLRHLKDFFGVVFKLEPYSNPDEDVVKHAVTKVKVTCMGIGYSKLI